MARTDSGQVAASVGAGVVGATSIVVIVEAGVGVAVLAGAVVAAVVGATVAAGAMLLVDGATVAAAVIGVAPVAPVPAPGPQAEPSTTRSTTTTVCLGKYGTTRCFHAFAPGARWATLRNVAGGGSTSRSGGSPYRSWLQPGPHWPPGGGRR